MFNEKLNKKLVDLYKIPGVMEVSFYGDDILLAPTKCWICHHRPCICEK